MSVNTKKMLRLSDSSPKIPMADSYIKAKKIKHWMMAGKDISRTGSADREKKRWFGIPACKKKTLKKVNDSDVGVGEIEIGIWRTCHSG
jgi:hypothetical protein